MAKKKSKKQASQKRTSSKKQSSRKGANVAPDATPGSVSAFFLGIMAFLSLVALCLPWYEAETTVIRGFEVLTNYEAVSGPLKKGFERVGGQPFITSIILFNLIAAVLGFGWSSIAKMDQVFKKYVADIVMVVVVASLLQGLILLLILLSMKAAPNVQWAGHAAAGSLLMVAFMGLLFAKAIDESENRTDSALETVDWAIWIGSLSATTLFHYQWICYGLVEKAPEALLTKLRSFR